MRVVINIKLIVYYYYYYYLFALMTILCDHTPNQLDLHREVTNWSGPAGQGQSKAHHFTRLSDQIDTFTPMALVPVHLPSH
jgi:hypothetical protein